jgi:hypothetical protein
MPAQERPLNTASFTFLPLVNYFIIIIIIILLLRQLQSRNLWLIYILKAIECIRPTARGKMVPKLRPGCKSPGTSTPHALKIGLYQFCTSSTYRTYGQPPEARWCLTRAGGIEIHGTSTPHALKIGMYKFCSSSTGNGRPLGAGWSM